MGSCCYFRGKLMTKPKSPHSYANYICMSRSVYKGSFLLVEGNSDVKLFNKFTDKNNCRVKGIPGKELAINVLRLLQKRNIKGVLLIVDADFDHLENKKPISKNMFYTDTHDIETMIMSTEAFKNFLSEFTYKKKLNKFEKKRSKSLRDILLNVCISIGYIRWANIRNSWMLKFKNLDFILFVDTKNLALNYNQFISELINNSPRNKVARSKIIYEGNFLKYQNKDPWIICSGHDLTNILLIGLRNIFGYNTGKLTRKKLEAILRLSYEFRFFQNTNLFNKLKLWEQKNNPYQIFH